MGLIDTIVANLRGGRNNLLSSQNDEQNPVAVEDDDYLDFRDEIRLSRALLAGTRGMQREGITFLPMYEGERESDYLKRLSATKLTNKYRHALRSHRGMVFSEPVKRLPDLPEFVEEWLDNIDMRGQTIDEWLPTVFFNGEADGVSPMLADQSPLAPGTTMAQAQLSGQRPRLVRLDPLSVIGRKVETIGDREVFTQLRIRETVTVDAGPYGVTTQNQIRVLEPGLVELWVQNDDEEWVLPPENVWEYAADEVTVSPFYTNETTALYGLPFLEDLQDKVHEHWLSSSDQRNYLKFARIPFHHFAGFDQTSEDGERPQDEIDKIGGGVMIFGPEGSSVHVIEHQGAAIEAGRTDLKDIEEACDVLGLLPALSINGGTMTATESSQKSAIAHSDIQALALRCQNATNRAIRFMAAWAGQPFEEDAIEISRDFSVSLEKEDIATIQGLLTELPNLARPSQELLLQEAKRRDLLTDKIDVDDYLDELAEDQGPTNGEVGTARAQARQVITMVQQGADVEEALDQVFNGDVPPALGPGAPE